MREMCERKEKRKTDFSPTKYSAKNTRCHQLVNENWTHFKYHHLVNVYLNPKLYIYAILYIIKNSSYSRVFHIIHIYKNKNQCHICHIVQIENPTHTHKKLVNYPSPHTRTHNQYEPLCQHLNCLMESRANHFLVTNFHVDIKVVLREVVRK